MGEGLKTPAPQISREMEGLSPGLLFSVIASLKVGVNQEGLTGINEAAAEDPKLYPAIIKPPPTHSGAAKRAKELTVVVHMDIFIVFCLVLLYKIKFFSVLKVLFQGSADQRETQPMTGGAGGAMNNARAGGSSDGALQILKITSLSWRRRIRR